MPSQGDLSSREGEIPVFFEATRSPRKEVIIGHNCVERLLQGHLLLWAKVLVGDVKDQVLNPNNRLAYVSGDGT